MNELSTPAPLPNPFKSGLRQTENPGTVTGAIGDLLKRHADIKDDLDRLIAELTALRSRL